MAHQSNDFFAAIDPVANRSFYGLDDDKVEPQYKSIFNISSDDEPIKSAAEFGGPASLSLKTENAAVLQKRITQGPIKTWNTATYAGAITISREAAMDVRNRFPKVAQSSAALGEAVRVTPELLTALFLDRAFNSAFPATADAVELCGTHVLPDGVTTSANELATPAALDESSLEDIRTALKGILGPSGNIMPLRMTAVIVPSALENIAMKLSTTTKQVGTANNDDSVVKGTKVKVFDYLGSSTRFFAETSKKGDGLFWDWIEKPQFLADQVIMQLQKVYVAFFRARYGCVDWRCIYGSAAT